MRASGPPVAHLAAGVPRLREGVLQIALPNGRLEAEGRRAMRRPEVAEALCRCYPEGTTIDVVKRAEGADNPFENDDMLREARRDPAVQRIAETLGATVTAVVSLRDGES